MKPELSTYLERVQGWYSAPGHTQPADLRAPGLLCSGCGSAVPCNAVLRQADVERLTALVRAYAGAWDELLSRVSDFDTGSAPVDDGIHAVVRWMLEIHLDKLP